MNAAEQAKSFEIASKIASIVNQFKADFPDARADLKPWANDQDTRELVDPNSIDIGFHFPGLSRRFHCRSLLVQIRFYGDPVSQTYRAIGIEIAGFDHRGKQWQLSTIGRWQFEGESPPIAEVSDKLKEFCRHAFELFNSEMHS
ncbi:MAG: hypothetical protein ACFE0I_17135 [Elainellaceae cyanobacterium]